MIARRGRQVKALWLCYFCSPLTGHHEHLLTSRPHFASLDLLDWSLLSLIQGQADMFSKIPQKFTAPFGLLGDEAKLAFPSHANGITKLATVRVCVDNYCYVSNLTLLIEHTGSRRLLGTSNIIHILHGEHYLYLDQYFILFDSASEVFSLIPPHHSAFDVHIHLFALTPPPSAV